MTSARCSTLALLLELETGQDNARGSQMGGETVCAGLVGWTKP